MGTKHGHTERQKRRNAASDHRILEQPPTGNFINCFRAAVYQMRKGESNVKTKHMKFYDDEDLEAGMFCQFKAKLALGHHKKVMTPPIGHLLVLGNLGR